MASYEDLRGLFAESPLRNRLEIACAVKAREIIESASPPAGALEWAGNVLTPSRTTAEAERMLLYLLAGSESLTVAEIKQSLDTTLQAAVDNAIDKLYPPA